MSLYITPNMLCLVILFELIRKIDILNRHKILALVCHVAVEFSCLLYIFCCNSHYLMYIYNSKCKICFAICHFHYLLYLHISNCHLYVGLIFLAAFDTTYFTCIFLIVIFMLVSYFLPPLRLLTLDAYF